MTQLTSADFPVSDTPDFTIDLGEHGVMALRVVDVRQGDAPRPFAVLFAGPASPVLAQRTFDVVHADLGTFPLFLGPVARTDEAVIYEAVFN